MAFFNSAVGVLQTLVIALGAGLGIWGVINLLEGYGNDNPGAFQSIHAALASGDDLDAVSGIFVSVSIYAALVSGDLTTQSKSKRL